MCSKCLINWAILSSSWQQLLRNSQDFYSTNLGVNMCTNTHIKSTSLSLQWATVAGRSAPRCSLSPRGGLWQSGNCSRRSHSHQHCWIKTTSLPFFTLICTGFKIELTNYLPAVVSNLFLHTKSFQWSVISEEKLKERRDCFMERSANFGKAYGDQTKQIHIRLTSNSPLYPARQQNAQITTVGEEV